MFLVIWVSRVSKISCSYTVQTYGRVARQWLDSVWHGSGSIGVCEVRLESKNLVAAIFLVFGLREISRTSHSCVRVAGRIKQAAWQGSPCGTFGTPSCTAVEAVRSRSRISHKVASLGRLQPFDRAPASDRNV